MRKHLHTYRHSDCQVLKSYRASYNVLEGVVGWEPWHPMGLVGAGNIETRGGTGASFALEERAQTYIAGPPIGLFCCVTFHWMVTLALHGDASWAMLVCKILERSQFAKGAFGERTCGGPTNSWKCSTLWFSNNYYWAGCVAKKGVLVSVCIACHQLLLIPAVEAATTTKTAMCFYDACTEMSLTGASNVLLWDVASTGHLDKAAHPVVKLAVSLISQLSTTSVSMSTTCTRHLLTLAKFLSQL